eukprot:scaffold106460_cov14-Tisochrysis_lutea.AAC.1
MTATAKVSLWTMYPKGKHDKTFKQDSHSSDRYRTGMTTALSPHISERGEQTSTVHQQAPLSTVNTFKHGTDKVEVAPLQIFRSCAGDVLGNWLAQLLGWCGRVRS